MENQDQKSILESLLFVAGEPQSVKKLAKVLKISPEETKQLADALAEDLKNQGRGLRLIRKDDDIQLVTAPECASWIGEMTRLDTEEDLTRSSLETLAIVAYRAPISRAGIEAVRGVNSTFTLRTLLLRGLVERYDNPLDQRSYLYRPTFDFMKHLGVEKIEDLPNFLELNKKLEKLEKTEGETAARGTAAGRTPDRQEENPDTNQTPEQNPAETT